MRMGSYRVGTGLHAARLAAFPGAQCGLARALPVQSRQALAGRPVALQLFVQAVEVAAGVLVPRLVTRPSLGWATAKDLVTIVASLITAVVSILVLFR